VLLLKPYLLEIQGHTEHTMFPFKLIIATIAAFSTIAQSQQFLIQNWGNGERATNYTYKSLEAGRF
jgi:endo-1,4-beta-xylanase